MYDVAQSFVASPEGWLRWIVADYGWMWLAMFWIVALGPLISWGFTYRRIHADPRAVKWETREDGKEYLVFERAKSPKLSILKAFGYGFAYVWLVQVSYVIAWRALFRLARGQNGWVKTRRTTDSNPVIEFAD